MMPPRAADKKIDGPRMGTAVKVHYLAYYELHELPWKLNDNIRYQDTDSGLVFELGRGPYRVPKMASPNVVTLAGGARIETVHDTYVLEGQTFVGVAIPVDVDGDNPSPASIEWDQLREQADDLANTVSLCLQQRTAPKRVAEYILRQRDDGKLGGMMARWQAQVGQRASVSARSRESVRRAIDHVHSRSVSPQVLTALRWHAQSKRVASGADRLIALWIALEALMGPVKNHKVMVKKLATHLALKHYRLNKTPVQITEALGLDHIRNVRNKVIHEGGRWEPWPISSQTHERDWPQILNDIVEEVLRYQLNATPARTLHGHMRKSLPVSSP